ncbi:MULTISPECIES: hypothetical protein [unclassified Janthinobacterium]|uniref:hypothetical protein n=1 Tax=unclassified Janthinobacterium TaxID=2610881 RepID=UPI0018CBA240|nr:hypothetical protein [Janthinobacterium sp. CG_23.4]MDH6160202.1 hypothetical protein [Janthinobacterium sp. CG_23.4]
MRHSNAAMLSAAQSLSCPALSLARFFFIAFDFAPLRLIVQQLNCIKKGSPKGCLFFCCLLAN